ncbi:MAG: alanine racemase [Bryobacteraceae bacterium]|jgi:D-serine deaminase-like pyridoxal phosphate-dependent protein
MTSRRRFLTAGAALGVFSIAKGRAARTSSTGFPYAEFEARIARRDFRDMTKDVLPTPCMVVDLDLFQANVRHMAETAKSNGINVRPHVKVHKSVDVARHQIAHGAIGLTCATIAEAELFSRAGIKGVLWTKQPVSVNNIQRAVALAKEDPTFMFVADDSQVLDWVEEAASARSTRVKIAISVFAGMTRQGIEGGQPALALAQKASSSKWIGFEGFMAYSGGAAHTQGFEARRKRSMEVLAGVRESRDLAKKAGLPVNIISGGSTGTYNIDHGTGLTELECGTYVFMDTEYFIIGGRDGDMKRYNDWNPALTVLTTVDSQHHPNIITTDYGAKALAKKTDEVKGMPWLEVGTGGAEYGSLKWKDGDRAPKLGDRIEIYCTNLDQSTNAFDRYYVTQGDQVVDVWPIMGRSGAAQR